MEQVNGLTEAIGRVVDPIPVLQRVVEQSLALVARADGAVVELRDGDCLVYVAAAGAIASQVGLRLAAATSLSGLAVRVGKTMRSDDTESDERVDRAACRRIGVRSMICVPLQRGSETVGVLKVTSPQPGALDHRDVATLRALADFITALIAASVDISEVTQRVLHGRPDTTAKATNGAPNDAKATNGTIEAFVADVLSPGLVSNAESAARVDAVLETSALSIVAQPIVDLQTGLVVGPKR